MKKKILIPLLCIIGAIMLVTGAVICYMSANTLGLTIGRCLVAGDGTYMMIVDDSPVVLSNTNGKEGLFDGLDNGDEILVLHTGIEETYPGRTGAYAVFKLDDGEINDISGLVLYELNELGWLTDGVFEIDDNLYAADAFNITSSWVNYYSGDELYMDALNADKMYEDSVMHLPIFKFEKVEDLEQFVSKYENDFSMDLSIGRSEPFSTVVKTMDEDYFEKYTVFLFYITTSSIKVQSVWIDDKNLCIHTQTVTGDGSATTCDSTGWFFTVSIEKDLVKNCINFDADNNREP